MSRVLSADSDCRDGSAVDNDFSASYGGSSVRGGEGDKLRDFLGPVGSPQWNAAQHVHQLLSGGCVIALVLLRHALNHARGGIGLDKARRDGQDANTLGADFVCQRLAVIRERRFRSGICERGIVKRQSSLDG